MHLLQQLLQLAVPLEGHAFQLSKFSPSVASSLQVGHFAFQLILLLFLQLFLGQKMHQRSILAMSPSKARIINSRVTFPTYDRGTYLWPVISRYYKHSIISGFKQTPLNSTNHRCSSDLPKTHPTSQACKFDTTKDMVEQHLNGVTSSKFIAVAQSIHTLPNSLL